MRLIWIDKEEFVRWLARHIDLVTSAGMIIRFSGSHVMLCSLLTALLFSNSLFGWVTFRVNKHSAEISTYRLTGWKKKCIEIWGGTLRL